MKQSKTEQLEILSPLLGKKTYKPVRVGNFWSNNYIEYESNGERNKTLSIKEYHIKPYLKDINNLKKSDSWKIQFKRAIIVISSGDIEEECIMHSKSDNIKISTLK